jgi:hypothetical protein
MIRAIASKTPWISPSLFFPHIIGLSISNEADEFKKELIISS